MATTTVSKKAFDFGCKTMFRIGGGMGSGVGVMLLHRQLLSPLPWVWPTKKILRRQQQEHNDSSIRRQRRRQVVLHHLDHIGCCCSGSAPGSSKELLQNRRWMLPKPDVQIHHISLSLLEEEDEYEYHFSSNTTPPPPSPFSFYVIRDDLLHPLVNGNKARKLDAILPLLQHHSVTDVVTCGGCQSAHTAATAVSCSERRIKSHLLLRGEQPDIPTGYNLLSLMYANHVVYVPRSVYANRDEMLREHARLVAGAHASVRLLDDLLDHRPCSTTQEQCTRNVVILNEGARGTTALLGVIRLVQYLSQSHIFGTDKPIKIVLDAGTGTTAIGLGIGVKCLGLPWKIVAVMLADTRDGYKKREKQLISDFKRDHGSDLLEHGLDGCDNGVVQWVERIHLRKFGKILQGEINICRKIAQQTGILVDPIYTLATWEHAVRLCQADFESSKVVMLHTGGTLGMFGLAQRYKPYFYTKA